MNNELAGLELDNQKSHHLAVVPVELQHWRVIGEASLTGSYPPLRLLTFVIGVKRPVILEHQPHESFAHRTADPVLDARFQGPSSGEATGLVGLLLSGGRCSARDDKEGEQSNGKECATGVGKSS